MKNILYKQTYDNIDWITVIYYCCWCNSRLYSFFGFKNSIIIMISLFVIVVIPALFMNRNGLAISDYWNFKIQLDDACICSIARKGGKKMCRWEQIEAVECRYSIIYSRISLLIWYKKRECIEIPDCMKESKELCLKIYKNIKEKIQRPN